MKLQNVYEGWMNYCFRKEKIETVVIARLKVCNECPEKIEMIGVKVCAVCHCPLEAKTRSANEECPLKKWPMITKEA